MHYGPPGTVDDYLQQFGRAGRDGEQAHAVLLFHGKQLRNLDGAVGNVIRNLDSCIREIQLKDFPGERQPMNDKHLCCNICTSKCSCTQFSVYESMYEGYVRECEEHEESDSEEEEYRLLSEDQKHQLHKALLQLKTDLDMQTSLEHHLPAAPSLLHGLENSVIGELLQNAAEIRGVDDVINKSPILPYSTACHVVEAFTTVFNDMDVNFDDQQDTYIYTSS